MWPHRIHDVILAPVLAAVLALVLALTLALLAPLALQAQTAPPPPSAPSDARAATGGAQTLEDILARQRGERIDDAFRRNAIGSPEAAQPPSAPLGTLGGASDPELWRALRYGEAELTASVPGDVAKVVIQDGGMRWLEWRRGPLPKYGGYLLLGMIALLVLFYLARGRIRLDGERTGRTVLRFRTIERIAHWSMAIPFILLAITGLSLLFGRQYLIPVFGKETYALLAAGGKYLHNYIAWWFMAGLVLSFFLWVWKNFPERADIGWLLRAGGLLSRGVHPPAGKFNAGEKIIFWIVIWFGAGISLTGLSLEFPFEIRIFSGIFWFLNNLGIPQMLGFAELRTALTPQEEMQFAQLTHAAIAFVFMAVIIAHIYLGSVGMEGALEAMTTGKVDVQWAKEHHSLWYEELVAKGGGGDQPASDGADSTSATRAG